MGKTGKLIKNHEKIGKCGCLSDLNESGTEWKLETDYSNSPGD